MLSNRAEAQSYNEYQALKTSRLRRARPEGLRARVLHGAPPSARLGRDGACCCSESVYHIPMGARDPAKEQRDGGSGSGAIFPPDVV